MESNLYNFAFKTLQSQAEQMQIEAELVKKLSHSGEKGREAEGIYKKFLSTMLPKRVSVGTGFTIDSIDRYSNQLDIIIFDSYFSPPVFQGYENSIININSLIVTIETKLTYRQDKILEAQKSANKVKRLSLGKKETLEHIEEMGSNKSSNQSYFYSKYYPYSRNELLSKKEKELPLCVMIAYTSDVKNRETILKHLNDKKNYINKKQKLPHHPGLDLIYIFDVGLFIWNGYKYESFFNSKTDNNKLFSTVYYLINSHISSKQQVEHDFISTWFNGILREDFGLKRK